MEDNLKQRQVCKTTHMMLNDNWLERKLNYSNKESIKARENVKELKRAAYVAAPTIEYVKVVHDLYVEKCKAQGRPIVGC